MNGACHQARAHIRPGRHLSVVPANAFLGNLPPWARFLTQGGWDLMPMTRPYLARNGTVTARLVWRRRDPADTLVLHWTVRGAMDDGLLDVLVAAMAPVPVGRHA